MLTYLFLLAAAIAAPEIPTIDLPPSEQQEIKELVAVLTQEIKDDASSSSAILRPSFAKASKGEQESDIALATSDQDERDVDVVAAPIIITNAIKPHMLEYKHWTGKYSPEQFAITVNGTEIELGKACEVSADTSTVEIAYSYSFMKGMRTGGKKISYQLNENITQVNITFDWKDDWRVILDNGKAKEIIS